MEYQTIVASDDIDLDGYVNEAMREGWVPLGGVSIAMIDGDHEPSLRYAQAMTRSASGTSTE